MLPGNDVEGPQGMKQMSSGFWICVEVISAGHWAAVDNRLNISIYGLALEAEPISSSSLVSIRPFRGDIYLCYAIWDPGNLN